MPSSSVWLPDGRIIAYMDYRNSKKFIAPIEISGKGKIIPVDIHVGFKEIILLAQWTPDNKVGALLITKQEYISI